MREKQKTVLLFVLIIGIVSMTVAFAALSTNLRITGTTNVAQMSWNIHFQNWQLDTQNTITVGSNIQRNTAVYPTVAQLTQSLAPNITKVEGIDVTLKQPHDYAQYKFQIINEGTIDSSLGNFTKSMTCTVGNNCSDVINYEVKCYESNSYSGTEITQNSVLEKNGDIAYCYLRIEYKDKTNSGNSTYSQDPLTATLSADWSWVQYGASGS